MAPVGDTRTRARSNKHGVGFNLLGTIGSNDFDQVRTDESGRAHDHPDTLTLEQLDGVALQSALNVFDTVLQSNVVDFGILMLKAHALDAPGEAHRSAGSDHRLRRNAVPQVCSASDDITLDQRDLGSQTGGIRGRGITCWTTTNDHKAS